LEPKWYLMLFEFFKKETSHQKWSDKCLSIIEEISKLFEKAQELPGYIGFTEGNI